MYHAKSPGFAYDMLRLDNAWFIILIRKKKNGCPVSRMYQERLFFKPIHKTLVRRFHSVGIFLAK